MGVMSKYKHIIIKCCAHCMTISVHKITSEMFQEPHWSKLGECDECGTTLLVCRVTKYQKPPGFARKCKKCYFRFACATTRLKETSVISYHGLMKIEIEYDEDEEEGRVHTLVPIT